MKRIIAIALLTTACAAGAVFLLQDRIIAWMPDSVRSFAGLELDGEAEHSRSRAITVRVANSKVKVSKQFFRTTGGITPARHVVLSSERAGRVAEVYVTDGDAVTSGTPIIRFDDSEAAAALAAAKAQLLQAERNLERQEKLGNKDFASQANIEDAATARGAAASQVEQAEKRLADQTVRAPFDGEIGFIDITVGAYLEPGVPIAQLASTSELRATFQLPNRIAGKVDIGAEVLVIPVGADGVIRTNLATLSPIAQSQTRSVTAEAEIPEGNVIRPGAFVTINVVTATRPDALFIAEQAIVRRGQLAMIFRVVPADEAGADAADRTVEMVPVELGERGEGLIEIRSRELSSSSAIVIEGAQKLDDRSQVRILSDPGFDPRPDPGAKSPEPPSTTMTTSGNRT